MPFLNKTLLIGRLTRNPELRYLTNGTPLTDIGIAVNTPYTTKEGEKKEKTLFMDCTAWGKLGETMANHLRKGRLVYIGGELETDEWEGGNGEKRRKVRVRVNEFEFLDRPLAEE